MTDVDDTLSLVDAAARVVRGRDGEPQFFTDPAIDRFVAVIMNIASEMWVQEERLRALEGKANGDAEHREEAVSAFINRVFAPLREPGAGG